MVSRHSEQAGQTGSRISTQTATAGSPRRSPGGRSAVSPRFTIGRDGSGAWIVQDRQGLVGGLFCSEAAALHFAAEESNHDQTEICRAPDGLILNIGHSLATAQLH